MEPTKRTFKIRVNKSEFIQKPDLEPEDIQRELRREAVRNASPQELRRRRSPTPPPLGQRTRYTSPTPSPPRYRCESPVMEKRSKPWDEYEDDEEYYNPKRDDYSRSRDIYDSRPREDYSRPREDYSRPREDYSRPRDDYSRSREDYSRPREEYTRRQDSRDDYSRRREDDKRDYRRDSTPDRTYRRDVRDYSRDRDINYHPRNDYSGRPHSGHSSSHRPRDSFNPHNGRNYVRSGATKIPSRDEFVAEQKKYNDRD